MANGNTGTAHQAAHHTGRRALIAIIVVVIVALVAAILVVGVSAKNSLDRIETQAAQASSAGTQLGSGISQLFGALSGSGDDLPDTGALVSQAQGLDDAVASIQSELTSWPWDVVAALPFVGSDVTLARDLVDDVRGLTQSIPPAMEELNRLASDNAFSSGGLPSLDGIKADIQTSRELISAIEGVRDAAQEAQTAIESLPDAHISQLTDAKNAVLDQIEQVNAAFDEHADVLDAIEGLGA